MMASPALFALAFLIKPTGDMVHGWDIEALCHEGMSHGANRYCLIHCTTMMVASPTFSTFSVL
jgi:hypothetical protein